MDHSKLSQTVTYKDLLDYSSLKVSVLFLVSAKEAVPAGSGSR